MTRNENATFPYKATLSEANVKINRVASTKCICRKERSFTNNFVTIFKNFVSV